MTKEPQELRALNKQAESKDITKISHALNRSNTDLTIIEQRIVFVFISKFNKKKLNPFLNEKKELAGLVDGQVVITAKEYSDLFGVDMKWAYRDLRRATEKLQTRTWQIYNKDKKMRRRVNWMSECQYYDGEGYVIARFNDQTWQHLVFKSNDRFVQLRLRATLSATTRYVVDIMLLLAQFADPKQYKFKEKETRTVNISLDEFRFKVDAPDSYVWQKIKERIIEPSLKQIKKQHGLSVTYKPTKTGRSVTGIIFKYRPNAEQLSLFGGTMFKNED